MWFSQRSSNMLSVCSAGRAFLSRLRHSWSMCVCGETRPLCSFHGIQQSNIMSVSFTVHKPFCAEPGPGLFTGWDQIKSEFSVQRASCASVTSCFLPLLHKSIKTLNHSLKSDDLLSVFKVRQSGPIKNPHWFCRVKLNFSCVLELQARWLLARHWIHTFPFHSFNHKLIDLFMVLSRWIKTVFFPL